jgi:hypothetical protein
LLSLDISSNILCVQGTKLLAKALEGNQTMTSLNISSSSMSYDNDGKKWGDVSGAAALADVIPGMGTLSMLTFSGDDSSSEPVTMETTMTEVDFSGKALVVSGGMMVAAFLPKCW